MKLFSYCLLFLAVLACRKSESDIVFPEYPDWYTIVAPVDKDIDGVWGNRDKTLLISTGDRIFRSTNQGRNWQQVHQQSLGMFGVVQYHDTLFTMSGLSNGRYLTSASNYSVDDGKTWQGYIQRGSDFDAPVPGSKQKGFEANPVTASNGTVYKINQVFLNGPTVTTGVFETPGVVTSDGRQIDLPQLHQLHSLYLDDQGRLYIAGTDAVCTRAGSGEKFRFCNSEGGRGVVYISKKPLP